MTITEADLQRALADELRALHQQWQDRQIQPGEFTARMYATINDMTVKGAIYELEKLKKNEFVTKRIGIVNGHVTTLFKKVV